MPRPRQPEQTKVREQNRKRQSIWYSKHKHGPPEQTQQWRNEMAAKRRESKTIPSKRMRALCYSATDRAKHRGESVDPSLVAALVANPPTRCACCFADLYYALDGGPAKRLAPSLDRYDNSKGYTLDNVRVICMRCNRLKVDATIDELKAVLHYLQNDPGPVVTEA